MGRSSRRPPGYIHNYRPNKNTRLLLEQCQEIFEFYADQLPLTNRQVFYRLVAAYDYPKTDRAAINLGERLSDARRGMWIPFDYIRDDTATHREHPHYHGPDAFLRGLRGAAKSFTQDKLVNQDVSIRVYCEAEGMVPQLHRALVPYSVPVGSNQGYVSLTTIKEIAEWCESVVMSEKTPVFIQLGDYDGSGWDIFESLRDDVLAFLEVDAPEVDPEEFIFERVALTGEQVEEYGLPTAPAKATDSRSARWKGETCQLEAMPPNTLADILCGAVESHMELGLEAPPVGLWSAAGSAFPAIVGPSPSNEPAHSDDHHREGKPEVDDLIFTLGTP